MTAPKKQHQQPETTLAPIPLVGGVLKPSSLHEAIEMAELIANSGMVPQQYDGKPGAVLVAIEMGAELGLQPMAAIQNIAVINGRPSLWGDAGLAIVRTHPQFVDIVEELDGHTAVCTIKRHGSSPITRMFSWDDAKKAGLASKKGPWSQYPKRMLQMRARWFAMRDAFPDALRGVHSAEESLDMVIEQTPEFIDNEGRPAPGRHSFTRPRAQGKEPVFDAPELKNEESPHNQETGEVIEDTEAIEPQPVAASQATPEQSQQALEW